MTLKTNHVIPKSSGWAVVKSGAERASKVFDTKQEAMAYARERSKVEKTVLYIHQRNGMVLKRISYQTHSSKPTEKATQ